MHKRTIGYGFLLTVFGAATHFGVGTSSPMDDSFFAVTLPVAAGVLAILVGAFGLAPGLGGISALLGALLAFGVVATTSTGLGQVAAALQQSEAPPSVVTRIVVLVTSVMYLLLLLRAYLHSRPGKPPPPSNMRAFAGQNVVKGARRRTAADKRGGRSR
ncbi:MAG: hypothetical protein KC416_13620 [Myxococcales bacterium]|nr:hypothetical protein [Myxococcales bacterium]